jgi:hypothetical protein
LTVFIEQKESKLPQTAKPGKIITLIFTFILLTLVVEEFEPESWSPVARQK